MVDQKNKINSKNITNFLVSQIITDIASLNNENIRFIEICHVLDFAAFRFLSTP